MTKRPNLDLLTHEVEELTDAELLSIVRYYNTMEPVGPCEVCGGDLSISKSTAGETVFACSYLESDPDDSKNLRPKVGRKIIDDHWRQSRVVRHIQTNPWVLELVRRYEEKQ